MTWYDIWRLSRHRHPRLSAGGGWWNPRLVDGGRSRWRPPAPSRPLAPTTLSQAPSPALAGAVRGCVSDCDAGFRKLVTRLLESWSKYPRSRGVVTPLVLISHASCRWNRPRGECLPALLTLEPASPLPPVQGRWASPPPPSPTTTRSPPSTFLRLPGAIAGSPMWATQFHESFRRRSAGGRFQCRRWWRRRSRCAGSTSEPGSNGEASSRGNSASSGWEAWPVCLEDLLSLMSLSSLKVNFCWRGIFWMERVDPFFRGGSAEVVSCASIKTRNSSKSSWHENCGLNHRYVVICPLLVLFPKAHKSQRQQGKNLKMWKSGKMKKTEIKW